MILMLMVVVLCCVFCSDFDYHGNGWRLDPCSVPDEPRAAAAAVDSNGWNWSGVPGDSLYLVYTGIEEAL